MQDLFWRQVQAPFGSLWLGALGGQLCQLSWTPPQYAPAQSPDSADQMFLHQAQEPLSKSWRPRDRARTEAEAEAEANHWLLDRAELQLSQYWSGQRKAFDLPLRLVGTDFQLRVWEELKAIPLGQLRSYAQVAEGLGKPGGARAVGRACGKNPLPLFIPCHRVVSSGGLLGGYNGGLAIKEFLLSLESPSSTSKGYGKSSNFSDQSSGP